MFKINLIEGIKNIDKNKTITYLSVILFTLLFLLQSYTYSYNIINELQKESSEHETVKNYQIYNVGGYPIVYAQSIFPELIEGFDIERETAEFYEALDNAQYVKYSGLKYGGICIEDFKGDVNTFIQEKWHDDLFLVHALYTTPNFHKAESYRVIKGRDFTDEDMVYTAEKPRAVLLGYKYIGVYEVGDILDMYYENNLQQGSTTPKLEVIGFLEEDTTVIDEKGTHVYDLDNCIVYPRYFIPIDEWDNCSDHVLSLAYNTDDLQLLSFTKYLIDSEHEAEGVAELQAALNEYAGFAKHYSVINRNQALEKIHTRTETFTNFAIAITGVLMAFAIVTVIFSVINRIENNLKDYAIHISLGASFNGIIGFVISEMAIILGCSMVLGLTVTKLFLAYLYMPYYFLEFLGIFAVTSLLVILLSAITAKLALKKYDLCTLIK